MTVLAEIGGILEVIFVLCNLMLYWPQTFLFQSSIISKIFLENKEKGRRDDIMFDKTNLTSNYKRINPKKKTSGRRGASIWDDLPEGPKDRGIFKRLSEGLANPNMNSEEFYRLRENVILRVPFVYTFKDFFKSKFHCCLCSQSEKRKVKRRAEMFERAQKKLTNEFDISKIVKKLRKFSIMKDLALKVHHQKLIKYFKKTTIHLTDSEDETNFPKEWQNVLATLGCFKKVVDGC
jgi:hypothetical protein